MQRKPIQKSKKKRKFDETKLGYLLKHVVPLEYRILLEASGTSAPSALLIEAISYASLDPFFKTDEFRQALIEYRKTGLRPPLPARDTPLKELRYIELRREKAKEYAKAIFEE